MKDFDETLMQNQPQPKRPLSADFTGRVMTRIANQSRPVTGFAKAKEHMKLLFKKPAFIIAALAVMSLGGTAYATTDGFTKVPEFLNAFLGKTETTPNGDTIVQVNTDCKAEFFVSYNQQTITGAGADPSVMYYRIQKDSKLTPAQVVATVQG